MEGSNEDASSLSQDWVPVEAASSGDEGEETAPSPPAKQKASRESYWLPHLRARVLDLLGMNEIPAPDHHDWVEIHHVPGFTKIEDPESRKGFFSPGRVFEVKRFDRIVKYVVIKKPQNDSCICLEIFASDGPGPTKSRGHDSSAEVPDGVQRESTAGEIWIPIVGATDTNEVQQYLVDITKPKTVDCDERVREGGKLICFHNLKRRFDVSLISELPDGG